LNGAFVLLARTGVAGAIAAFVRFALTLNVAQLQSYAAGIGTVVQVLVGMINTANVARLAIMALKVSLVSLGVGVVLIALDAVAQSLLGIGGAAVTARNSVAELRQELNRLAELGLVEEAGGKYLEAKTKLIAARAKQAAALKALRQAETAATAPGADASLTAAAINTAQSAVDEAGRAVTAAVREVETTRRARDLAFKQRQRAEAEQAQLQKIDLSEGEGQGRGQSKLQKYYSDQSKLLQSQLQEKLNLLALDKQTGKISEYQYQIEKARLELINEEKIISEGLRVARAEVNNENLSAQDKSLKLADLQRQAEQDLAAARSKSALALGEAYEQITRRFDLQAGRPELERQGQEIAALEAGYSELTPDVKAYLDVYEKTIDLSREDQELFAQQINNYRAQREQYYKNAEALKFLNEQLSLQQELALAQALTPDDEMLQRILNQGYSGKQALQLFDLSKQVEQAKKVKEQITDIASSISESFGAAIKNVILGASSLQEALAGVFQGIAESFADMVAKMIAEWLLLKLITGIGNLFGVSGGGPDRATTSLLEINKYAGANGGIAPGGWKPFPAFANGGMVTGPTLGLVGEGRYNEAIVPLPDGKSIPVSLQGDGGGNVNVVVNVDAKGTQVQGNEPSGRELGRVISAAVQSEIIKQQRPGGLLTGSR
jgi:hypothetical protein